LRNYGQKRAETAEIRWIIRFGCGSRGWTGWAPGGLDGAMGPIWLQFATPVLDLTAAKMHDVASDGKGGRVLRGPVLKIHRKNRSAGVVCFSSVKGTTGVCNDFCPEFWPHPCFRAWV